MEIWYAVPTTATQPVPRQVVCAPYQLLQLPRPSQLQIKLPTPKCPVLPPSLPPCLPPSVPGAVLPALSVLQAGPRAP